MKESVWESSTKLPEFTKLKKDIKTDVLIIGGGLAGILCAYFLKQAGVSYVLVEGSKIASGTTKNTTAKITSQHGLIYDKLIQKFGKEKAQMYLSANEKALKEYDKLCQAMDCDYEKKSAFTYSTTDRKKIEDEVRAVISLGFNAEFRNKTELPFNTKGAICFQNQAQFNPIKFICEISKDLNIYENTF
ncbi:MAG: FAD-binding oxidoreductase, partial [Clostridia bacterium]|nr:FAD-binding oxidoreductase [Clostridia bacterium]